MAAAPPRQEERHAAAKAPLARSGSLAARLRRRRWRVAGLAAALVGGSGAATGAEAHGMMTEPRTRNVVAAQDGVWWQPPGSPPMQRPESCPHCLNRGGSLAACGIVEDRNYDKPTDSSGNVMSELPVQATFDEGGEVTVSFTLTAHHKGHVQVSVCPDADVLNPKQECFDANRLEFVRDPLYGAPRDANYPERGYVAPNDGSALDMSAGQSSATIGASSSSLRSGMAFEMVFKLPEGINCDHCLLQWHYISGNSCEAPGYAQAGLPAGWRNAQLGVCDEIPADGNGTPEQFWNCADISIRAGEGDEEPAEDSPAPVEESPTPTPVEESPTPTPVEESPTPSPSPAELPADDETDASPSERCDDVGTGMIAMPTCGNFMHCVAGEPRGNPIACPPGTLFDERVQACNWANLVNCDAGDALLAPEDGAEEGDSNSGGKKKKKKKDKKKKKKKKDKKRANQAGRRLLMGGDE